MFKDRAIQLKFVKTDPEPTPESKKPFYTVVPEQINQIAKEQVKHAAIAVIAVYSVVKVMSTLSEIAINAAPKR